MLRRLFGPATLAILAVGLLSGGLALAKKPPDKGPPKASGTADFTTGDLLSNVGLNGSFSEAKDCCEFLNGQLGVGETLTVGGAPGTTLGELGSSVLPPGAVVSPAGCDLTEPVDCEEVFFDDSTNAIWSIRLDLDETPLRVQFKVDWFNANDEHHFLRVGWLSNKLAHPPDYGELTRGISLRDADIEFLNTDFVNDPFQIDGQVKVGKGKKTATVIYSDYFIDGDRTKGPEDGVASFTITTSVP